MPLTLAGNFADALLGNLQPDVASNRTISGASTATYDLGTSSIAWRTLFARSISLAREANTQTLTGTKTLVDTDPTIHYLNPGAASKLVTLPAVATANSVYIIANLASAATNNLGVQTPGGVVLETMAGSTIGLFISNGTEWKGTMLAGSGGGGAPTTSQYVTLALDGTLSAERVLTGTANQITITDAGANGNVTLSTPQNIHSGASVTFEQATIIANASINAQLTVGKLISSSRNAVELAPWGTEGSATGELRFLEKATAGSNIVGFKAPSAITNDNVWILPDHAGTSGQSLRTLGTGASGGYLYWGTEGGAGTASQTNDPNMIFHTQVFS